jgi:hypothetical protein
MERVRRIARWRDLIITVVVVLIGVFWLGTALPDRDWLWFVPIFNEEAARIHLYRDGKEIMLQRSDPGYEEVNEAINQIVRHVTAKEPVAMSLESLEDFYNQFSAVEAFYSEPVIIHTRHGFPKADKYLFPQSGRLDDPPVVFAGMQRQPDYRGDVLVLSDRERLDEAVDAAWALNEPE